MRDWVSAGDVGRFAYCPLNWKLSRAGHEGTKGEAGLRSHEELAEHVDALELYQAHIHFTLQAALYLALFATSAAGLGVELFALDRASRWWWVLVLLSVLWVAASAYLFVFHLYYKDRAKTLVRERRLQPGQVILSDPRGGSELLESDVLPLRGRPDYVIERDGQPIPVEYKSGKTPTAPYESHVLQLAAYCYLVQEAKGARPPFGILAYPEREFEIPYTEDLEQRLLKTLLRIELAVRTGEAHRDHENPKRCLGCSRRAVCPERLA